MLEDSPEVVWAIPRTVKLPQMEAKVTCVWQLLLLWSVLVPDRCVCKVTEVWGNHLDPGSGIKNASFKMIRYSLKPS